MTAIPAPVAATPGAASAAPARRDSAIRGLTSRRGLDASARPAPTPSATTTVPAATPRMVLSCAPATPVTMAPSVKSTARCWAWLSAPPWRPLSSSSWPWCAWSCGRGAGSESRRTPWVHLCLDIWTLHPWSPPVCHRRVTRWPWRTACAGPR